MKRVAPRLVAALSFAAVFAGAPPAAAASSVVYVIKVNDGDTMDVSAKRDGTVDYKVRLIGINTPEGHWSRGKWTGTCGSKAAHDRLEALVEHKWIELRAASLSSSGSGGRKLRFVHLRNAARTDVNAILLREGHAVAYPKNNEPARNGKYIRLAQAAAKRKVGVWNPARCGWGPAQNVPLRVRVRHWVSATPEGAPNSELNKEYVRIENNSATAVALKGWVLRDSSSFYYYFRDSTKVPANGSVTVHTGKGATSGTTHKHYYWGQAASVWAQERLGMRSSADAAVDGYRDSLPPLGDGAYLYDPRRDLRAHMTYPCLKKGNATCSDAAMGDRVAVGVKLPVAGSGSSNDAINVGTVSVKNTSATDINLTGYMLDSWPWNYEIEPGTTLAPGETLRVRTGTGSNTRLEQYWGLTKHIFWKPDYVELRRLQGHVAERVQWQDCVNNECGDYS